VPVFGTWILLRPACRVGPEDGQAGNELPPARVRPPWPCGARRGRPPYHRWPRGRDRFLCELARCLGGLSRPGPAAGKTRHRQARRRGGAAYSRSHSGVRVLIILVWGRLTGQGTARVDGVHAEGTSARARGFRRRDAGLRTKGYHWIDVPYPCGVRRSTPWSVFWLLFCSSSQVDG